MRAIEKLKSERMGLLLIAAALVALVVTGCLLLRFERNASLERDRAQGLSLARLLASMPYERLVSDQAQLGPLQLVQLSQGNPDFAYASVLDLLGKTPIEVTAPGVIVPVAGLPEEPSAWVGEATRSTPGSDRRLREFFAPVLVEGERVAQVRVGFFEPSYAMGAAAQRFPMLALPIFLLVPFSYFFLRREIRPLGLATTRLSEICERGISENIQLEPSGELREFIHAFNRFLSFTQKRVEQAHGEQQALLASSRVAAFQKHRLEVVLEALPSAALVMDETGVVGFASAKLETLLGVPRDRALGQRPAQWCTDPSAVAFLESYCRSSGRGRQVSGEVELSVHEASERMLCMSAHPLERDEGSSGTLGTLILVRDQTSEALSRKAQAEFVMHMSHELKTPLNTFAMYSELLLGKDGSSEEFRMESCNAIQDEVERLSTLVQTLLSVSRLEMGVVSLQRQRVRLKSFLQDALESVSRSGRTSQVSCQLHVSDQLPAIRVDKDLFRVALNNLLTNAIKYNREGGTVSVEAQETSNEITISVKDTGIGVAEEDIERLFDKFFRSESAEVRKRSGHGLGLSLAREIVHLHGGRLKVQSLVGEGSEFAIVLRKNPILIGEQLQ